MTIKPFDKALAQKTGLHFYELPQNLDIACVDALIRPIVIRINESGWVWTAESCQGHPEYDENSIGAWEHNTDPYLRLIVVRSRFGEMLAHLARAMSTRRMDQHVVTLKLIMWPQEIEEEFEQVMVYLPATNVLRRNMGLDALRRFAESLQS